MNDTTEKLVSLMGTKEKVYFARFSKMKKTTGKPNYMVIYDLIKKNGNVQNALSKISLSNQKYPQYLSAEKDNLLENLLLSLVNYHMSTNIYRRIIKDILFCSILIDKGLRDKALKYIKRAKSEALRYEEFVLTLLIIEIEENLLFRHGFILNSKKLRELDKERTLIIDLNNNLNAFKILKASFQDNELNNFKMFFNNREEINHLPNFQMLSSEDYALSTKAKIIWTYLNSFLNFKIRNLQAASDDCEVQLRRYHKYPDFFTQEEYLQLLQNYSLNCARLRDEDRCKSLLDELALFKVRKEDSCFIQIIEFLTLLELLHQQGNTSYAFKIAKETENYLSDNLLKIDQRHIKWLGAMILRAYVEKEEYQNAGTYILKSEKGVYYNYYDIMSKIFEFMVYYKTKRTDILEYSVNSWSKVLQKKRKLNKAEKVLFSFFRQVHNSRLIHNEKPLLRKTIINLEELENDSNENFLFEFFNFRSWFEKELSLSR